MAGSHAIRCTGQAVYKLLNYMIITGKTDVVEGLLRFDENNIEIDELLLKFTRRLKCIYYYYYYNLF